MTQVLILSQFHEGGVRYAPGEVVDFASSSLIAARKAAGNVDDASAAVSAAIGAGAVQRVHATEIVAAADAEQGRDPGLSVVNVTGTDYTLKSSDEHVVSKSGSATTITVPDDSVAMRLGKLISIEQDGAGAVSIVGASGVTVNPQSGHSAQIAGQYGVAQLIKKGSNRWTLFGALA